MTENNAKNYMYQVKMNCMNCVKNLEKALGNLKGKGIEEYEVLFEEQKVAVKSTMTAEEILNVIKSTGKEDASIIPSPT